MGTEMRDTKASASVQEQLDQVAVNDIIQRERLARDSHAWDEMASYYHTQSMIEVSWFRGTGAEFVQSTRRALSRNPDAVSLHVMSPAVVTVHDDRAIAETACSLRSFQKLGELDVSREGFVRLLWRAQRQDGRWLIAGLRCIYIRDLLIPYHPGRVPVLDEARLNAYRPSYRYLSYLLTDFGLEVRDDLPGTDRPETVAALRTSEARWLRDARAADQPIKDPEPSASHQDEDTRASC